MLLVTIAFLAPTSLSNASFVLCAEEVPPDPELTEIQQFAYTKVVDKFGSEQWDYFDKIMEKESGWDYRAKNPNSSATGIPQALVKTHELGEEYTEDPYYQVLWGVDYIESTYGTPHLAWKFHLQNNYY